MVVMTGLVAPIHIGVSSLLPVEVKAIRRSNPVYRGFFNRD